MDPLARAGAALSAETPAGRARRLLEGAPGPWTLQTEPDYGVDSSGSAPGRRTVVLAGGVEVASDLLASEEQLALMAAAPDLARDLIAEAGAHEVTRAALADALRERPHLRGGYDTMAGALGMFPGATPEQVVEFVIRLGAANAEADQEIAAAWSALGTGPGGTLAEAARRVVAECDEARTAAIRRATNGCLACGGTGRGLGDSPCDACWGGAR